MHELTSLRPHGVFLRRDALRMGYDDRDLARALRSGLLTRIRHGAYVEAEAWAPMDEAERHIARAHAVMLTHNSSAALSHVSGAALHGMHLWRTNLSRIHVTRLAGEASRKHHDVAYHDDPVGVECVDVGGARVLSAARCAIGAASLSSVESGVVLVDSAYQLGLVTVEDLRREFECMHGWPGTARLQITLRLASPGSDSVGESRSRFLFWIQGLPCPQLQYPIFDGTELVGVTDFAWPELGVVGEFDGRIKYGRLLPAGESAGDVIYREKLREDRIREVTGWRVVRLTWSDLDRPRQTAERFRTAFRRASP